MDIRQPMLPPSRIETEISEMDRKKLKKAAQDMEAEFMKILMKEMKKTLTGVSFGEKAPGKEMMTEMMIERYAEISAKEEPLGIAKMIYERYAKTESPVKP